MRASQKLGTEAPRTEMPRIILSVAVFLLIAEMMPKRMPKDTAITMANTASSSVAGK